MDEKPVLKPHNDNEWSLVCSSVQEWSEIVEKYQNTRSKNEKLLLKGLQDLNGIMPELFAEKVKNPFEFPKVKILNLAEMLLIENFPNYDLSVSHALKVKVFFFIAKMIFVQKDLRKMVAGINLTV